MRIYKDLYEAVSETERNLGEMGIEVQVASFQNKLIDTEELKNKFLTKEIQGETFIVQNPLAKVEEAYEFIFGDDAMKVRQWVAAEFTERIGAHKDNLGSDIGNPGEAWKLRPEVWEELLVNGKFEYTYNERLFNHNALNRIIRNLQNDLSSRRQVLLLYDMGKDLDLIDSNSRIPCSVSYSWLIRQDELLMFYHMRSCDFYTHFLNDIMLAGLLNKYIAAFLSSPEKIIKPGRLQMMINSLHAYKNYLKTREIF